jgi:hypothetical protein
VLLFRASKNCWLYVYKVYQAVDIQVDAEKDDSLIVHNRAKNITIDQDQDMAMH